MISLVCLATLVKLDAEGRRIDDIRLSLAGVGPKPLRLNSVEDFLRGGPVTAGRFDEAAEMPVSLVASRTRQEYRREVVRGFHAARFDQCSACRWRAAGRART